MESAQLVFTMPGDQEWDSEFWERVGVGPEWDRLNAAFEAAGATVEDAEDVGIAFEDGKEDGVRAVIAAARAGEYGADVRVYWTAAKELLSDDAKEALLEEVEERLGITGSLPDDEQSSRSRQFLWDMLGEGPQCVVKVVVRDQAYAVFSKAPLADAEAAEWASVMSLDSG